MDDRHQAAVRLRRDLHHIAMQAAQRKLEGPLPHAEIERLRGVVERLRARIKQLEEKSRGAR